MSKERIAQLKQQIADVKKRWPMHDVPPALMAQLDDLEDELCQELKKEDEAAEAAAASPSFGVFTLRAIGRVENPYDTPAPPEAVAAVASRIVLDPALLPGLGGLAVGGQVLVVFYFHKSEPFDPARHLFQHPRGDESRAEQGVFSLCSPLRPCPLGVTVVDLIGIEGNVLRVRGLDALNGTPVLDLKPV